MMRTRSTWPPAMPRLPIPEKDEDGEPVPPEMCHFGHGRTAVFDVPVGDMTGRQWRAVCGPCADQMAQEWAAE